MNEGYLNRVLIYLQQDLLETYREHIKLSGDKLVISIEDTANFSQVY